MSEIVKEAWKKYLTQLQLHPLRTKAITYGILVGSSDVITQKISGVKRLQVKRILLLMLYGFAYSGPFGHFLHKLMDVIFRGKKGRPWGLVKKQGSKGLSLYTTNCMEVLADCWLDQLPVHAPAITRSVPQVYCFMLGNFLELEGKIRNS